MPRAFDLNLLPVLLAIHDHGGVSAAARHLGLGQPAVSAALARLREHYHDPLFLRRSHGMEPTATMRSLVAPLRESLAKASATWTASPAFDPATTERRFTFAMSDLGEMVFLPKIVQRIHRHAPRATLRSVAAAPADIARGLETGEIDLAVGYFPTCARSRSSSGTCSSTTSSACCAPTTRCARRSSRSRSSSPSSTRSSTAPGGRTRCSSAS
jgi:DNA-binding transcriptional LysR family regulator